MIQEVIDGSKCTDLHSEDDGERQWHMIEREGGSISLYYTYARSSGAHYVVFDTLDGTPPSAYAQAQLETVAKLYAACGVLLRVSAQALGR